MLPLQKGSKIAVVGPQADGRSSLFRYCTTDTVHHAPYTIHHTPYTLF
jgi:ABC-type protease/lipase transport system fused ATPase/permease subunit